MSEKANEQHFERKHPVQQSLKDTFRAQNGEDRWLDNLFGHKRNGFFVEVGAFDGINLSNSYHFEQIGWTGVLIEPDPDKAALCRSNRPGSKTYQCAAAGSPEISEVTFFRVESGEVFSTTKLTSDHARRIDHMGLASIPISVPARTLDTILQEAGAPAIDFVSIDVEGAETEVLRGFDIRRWKPAIVVIESNSKFRLPEVRDYFTSNGYAFRCSIDVNDFYLRVDPGPVPAWAIDAAYYAWRRVNRRISKLAHNIRRSWNKRRGRKT
ncbi:MAG: FkbM family methyltransferase [Pseudomonadota bacterium]